jgi:hypothetical protein
MSLMLGLLVVVWYFRRLTLWFVVSSIAPNKSSFKWLKLADLGGAVRKWREIPYPAQLVFPVGTKELMPDLNHTASSREVLIPLETSNA